MKLAKLQNFCIFFYITKIFTVTQEKYGCKLKLTMYIIIVLLIKVTNIRKKIVRFLLFETLWYTYTSISYNLYMHTKTAVPQYTD